MTAEQGSRVLVTGGSGFIGRRLVRALLDSGAEVTVADLLEPTEPGVHAVVGDLRDESVAARAVSPGTDTIFHLAAVTSVLRSLEDPAGTYQTNVQATATLLELARTRGVGSFILASTNAVVGDVGRNVITEQAPLHPLTPYGATKAAGEMLVSCYTAAYGIAGCALRFSNVYGPGMQHKDSFVPRLMRAARDGHGVQVYGDGTQIRDLIHVDDIVSALLLAWRSRATGSTIIGAGESVTVNDIIAAARSVTGAPIPVENIAPKPGEMPAVIVDISAARAMGYRPTHDLKSGIATVWPEFAPAGGAGSRYRGAGPGWKGCTVTSTRQDAAVDNAAATAFFSQNGERATALPPVAIVIAAYNEEGVVGSVVDALPNTLCGLGTMPIVVSDGSKDGTVEEANAHGALVCDVPVNRGQGAALRLGYRLAREGGAQYIITTDADGQYNPAEMDAVLRPVVDGRADFVTGSRKLGSQETNDPVRRLGTWVFAVTISLLTGQRITDSSFGLRAMRAEVTGAVRLEQPQYQSSELLIAVLTHGFRVAEVPATIHKRKVGESKKGHNAIYGLKYAGVVLGTWWRERQRRVPGSGRAASSRAGARPGERSAALSDHADPFTRARRACGRERLGAVAVTRGSHGRDAARG